MVLNTFLVDLDVVAVSLCVSTFIAVPITHGSIGKVASGSVDFSAFGSVGGGCCT